MGPGNPLNDVQVVQSQSGKSVSDILPGLHSLSREVHHHFRDLGSSPFKRDGEGTSLRPRARTISESCIFRLGWFMQENAVELELFGSSLLANQVCSGRDFLCGEGI
jgi:hypothetical protein